MEICRLIVAASVALFAIPEAGAVVIEFQDLTEKLSVTVDGTVVGPPKVIIDGENAFTGDFSGTKNGTPGFAGVVLTERNSSDISDIIFATVSPLTPTKVT